MSIWLAAKECVGLPDFPTRLQNIRSRLDKYSGENENYRRRRDGTKAFEYHIDCFPEHIQEIIKSRFYAQALETQVPVIVEPSETKTPRSTQLATDLDLMRQCPALLERKMGELTGNQKDIADARAILAQEVLKLIRLGSSRTSAVKMISEQSRDHTLPPHLQRAADAANARKGKSRKGVSVRSLQEWVTVYQSTTNGAERLALLAPGHHKARKPEQVAWLPAFLVHWRDTQGFSMKECYRKFCKDWEEHYQDEPAMLLAVPSYDAIRREMNKMPKRERMRGRITGSTATSLEPYQKRDWSQLPVNGCWISDGKSMSMKVAHPMHGQPFIPELTLVMDGRTRFVVGWSLSYSENKFGVAEAYARGIKQFGKPLFVYSDNGGGQANKMLDDEVLGIFSRMGIEHLTGIPGHPQARGIIERLNGVIPERIAQRFKTYNGRRADKETIRVLDRNIRSAINAQEQNKPLDARQRNAIAKLPSWGQLMDAVQEEVDKYNNSHEHSMLPKVNGKYLTPAQYRAAILDSEGDDIAYLSEMELREMFKPQFSCTCSRGWVRFQNNQYFAYELADFDGQKVRISVDMHNPKDINVYRMDGSWICTAIWNGNTHSAIPISMVEEAKAKRAKAQTKRLEDKIDVIKKENRPVIEHKPDFSGFLPSEAATSDDKPIAFLQSDLIRNSRKAINE
ncbi:Mu transposase C-terminal domain-containing protein [Providencia manganoxydans]|uniref:Mu transposase C-terminal domain-containing protein n=1 Tax=Providencia TaxID=586 RepID=UPI00298E0343|nr:Mu transposase C-terminal domain-containing protein [Providencia sp. 2023EL-00965]MDW7590634.1 Mu transposase C-terminal domain-containing protein [Providencia sp. 2023EL-00965]